MHDYGYTPECFDREYHLDGRGDSLFISAGVNLLLPELNAINEANTKRQIRRGWQTSPSFRSALWRNFKEQFNLTSSGFSGVIRGGQERFKEVNAALHLLKGTVTLLSVLEAAAQSILIPFEAELTRTGHAFGRLLESLPTELLASTLRFASDDIYDLIKLSHVNRRFRNVALSISDIWSANVQSFMHIEVFRLCLQRSKNAPLHFDFDEDGDYVWLDYPVPEEELRTRFSEIVRQSSRLKSLRFHMPEAEDTNIHGDSFLRYRTIGEIFSGIHAPRLTTLTLSHTGFLPDIPVAGTDLTPAQIQIMELVHFYRSWKAPNLRFLEASSIIPVAIPGSSIETLSLDLCGISIDFVVALRNLHAFLRETPTLREMNIRTYTCGETAQNSLDKFPVLVLESLQEMTLRLYEETHALEGQANRDVHFSSLIDCLQLPVLSTLVVKIDLAHSTEDPAAYDVTSLVNSFIPQQLCATRVTDLSLHIYDRSPMSRRVSQLELGSFPAIRNLTLGTSTLLVSCVTLHPNVVKNGTLEQINLLGCTNGVDGFLSRLFARLGDGGDGLRNLRKVMVKQCLPVKKRNRLRFVPKEILEFEGRDDAVGDKHVRLRNLGYY